MCVVSPLSWVSCQTPWGQSREREEEVTVCGRSQHNRKHRGPENTVWV